MPFPFSSVCDLLSKLERIQLRNPPVLPKDLKEKSQQEVQKWFRRNRLAIDAHTTDQVALLSTLFPERRTDRKFELREARLCKVLGRCLLLNKEKKDVLDKWRTPGNGDLGICAEKAQREFDVEMKPGISITVEEVDQALELLASRSQFSGPNFRSFSTPPSTPPEILEPVFRKMTSHELKWAVRLILKDFSPVILDERLVLTEFHFLLPGLLKFQDSFAAAVPQLRGVLSKYHAKPDYRTQHLWRKEADKLLAPQVGMKVGRPPFLKARSIQSAVQLAGTQKWTLERKYDGEYCEIHVDLSKSPCTQIFSKSGKDSTDDRRRVHAAIRQGLKIGQPDCLFTEKCIVVGELVVWNNRNKTIAGFEKIRKHVTRSGRYIGTEEDSQPHPWENLMIVYFDVLLIDNEITMRKPQFERRDRLNKLIQKKEGIAITADWNAIDFSHQKEAPEKLCTQLAAALASRFEGLVLKPAELPYFTFGEDHGQYGSFIKLKKDYLPELGGERDVADFAIVGASYDPKQAHKSGLGIIPYTTFHIGCIREEDTVRFGRKPVFEIVGTITQEKAIPKPILQALNDYGRFQSQPFERTGNALKDSELLEFDLILDHNESSKMAVIFTQPGVVEILGSSYEQVQNKNYFMLRHPRISKIHLDRDWKEATTMDQLKQMAEEARTAPTEGQSQELSQLTKKLMNKFKRKFEKERSQAMSSQDSTQRTVGTYSSSPISSRRTPPSSRRSPTLIRVDTSELLPGENQSGFLKPLARTSLNSGKDSLQTPPRSHKILSTEGSRRPTDSASSSQRKRKENLVPSTPTLKRARTESMGSKSSRPLTAISDNVTRSFPPSISYQGAKIPCPKLLNSKSEPIPGVPKPSTKKLCNNPSCLFAQVVAYLSPCISHYRWVSESLLDWHGTARALKLLDWQRELQDLSPGGSMISESAAWPGLQKIVLLETNRAEESRSCVDEVIALKIRDDVIFFDWRIMEELREVEEIEQESALRGVDKEMFRKHWFGMTRWTEQGAVEFLDELEDIGDIPASA